MKFNWRASAFAAAAALLLSFLTGLITGVPFATLIGRALLGATVFAVAAAGISFVTDRFLPGLGSGERGGRPDDDRRPGSRVDVVIDDPMDEEGERDNIDRDGDESGAEDGEELVELEAAGEDERYYGPGDPDEPDDQEELATPESLPDIEGLSGSFAETPIGLDERPHSAEPDEGPGMMARAIRTVMRREQ
jgi:hypothetical protein